jgi:hypothetical protein
MKYKTYFFRIRGKILSITIFKIENLIVGIRGQAFGHRMGLCSSISNCSYYLVLSDTGRNICATKEQIEPIPYHPQHLKFHACKQGEKSHTFDSPEVG